MAGSNRFSSELTNEKKKYIGKFLLTALFFLGFSIRLYFLVKYGSDITLKSDDLGYTNSALHLIKTGTLSYGYPTPTAFIMPAYPLFLSLMLRLFGTGAGLIAARLVQIFVCMAGIYFVYLLSRQTESRTLYPALCVYL